MEESNKRVVRLRQNAWYGDTTVDLRFPAEWTVKIFGDQFIPTLSDSKIQHEIRTPIGSPPLSELAAGKSSATILLDDLSRPTPTARLLPIVLDELLAGGIKPENIAIVIAGGTHLPASANEIVKKTGGDLPSGVRVMAHDCRQALVDLGRTPRGTPIQINQQVYESDLKIGIGCIYPHQCAGFSGGAKILAPGATGFETIRALHDNMRGSKGRGGSVQNQFRDEVEDIVDRVGLDFIVNVTLNQKREIASAFAGDRIQAFNVGVEYAKEVYAVETYPNADVTIVDMYPFDISYQVASGRGFWPFEFTQKESSKILLAGCPEGLSSHDLFSVSDQLFDILKRRIKNFRLRQLLTLDVRFRALWKRLLRRKITVFVLSENLEEEDLINALPGGKVIANWEKLVDMLIHKHGKDSKTTVAIYRCAPMMYQKKE